jgi:hypothetical protein
MNIKWQIKRETLIFHIATNFMVKKFLFSSFLMKQVFSRMGLAQGLWESPKNFKHPLKKTSFFFFFFSQTLISPTSIFLIFF